MFCLRRKLFCNRIFYNFSKKDCCEVIIMTYAFLARSGSRNKMSRRQFKLIRSNFFFFNHSIAPSVTRTRNKLRLIRVSGRSHRSLCALPSVREYSMYSRYSARNSNPPVVDYTYRACRTRVSLDPTVYITRYRTFYFVDVSVSRCCCE